MTFYPYEKRGGGGGKGFSHPEGGGGGRKGFVDPNGGGGGGAQPSLDLRLMTSPYRLIEPMAQYRNCCNSMYSKGPAPPLSLIKDTHQRSKNAKKGVLLGVLRMCSKLKKRVFFQQKFCDFLKIGALC